MPYLKDKSRREELDKIVNLMEDLCIQDDGEINYILYTYAVRNVDRRYNPLKDFLSELREAECEIRRRLLIPAEEYAIVKNGDIE